ncbi:MAG: type II toxin-antitoxin system RelE/ParE family toxin [Acidiferrobacterales bacterium]
MKDVTWHGDSREVVRGFPEQARKDLGAELMLLQLGETPLHSRPMPSVGRGVWEIKVRDESKQYRVFYVVKRREAIHVLHAFEKTSRKTAKADIELGKQRLKEV